eukprot:SAG31_NODE_3226_length_4519_cov_1.834163_2_plen_281_part_00
MIFEKASFTKCFFPHPLRAEQHFQLLLLLLLLLLFLAGANLQAFAKLFGCYEVCAGGTAWDAFKYLTACSVVKFASSAPDSWDAVCAAVACNAFISTSVSENILEAEAAKLGLLHGHAYAILHAVTTKAGAKLLMLKNPWGSYEWRGKYADDDVESWTPALKSEVDKLTNTTLGSQPREDGSFWMQVSDETHVLKPPPYQLLFSSASAAYKSVHFYSGQTSSSCSTNSENVIFKLRRKCCMSSNVSSFQRFQLVVHLVLKKRTITIHASRSRPGLADSAS